MVNKELNPNFIRKCGGHILNVQEQSPRGVF